MASGNREDSRLCPTSPSTPTIKSYAPPSLRFRLRVMGGIIRKKKVPMYAVIFRATINKLDEAYSEIASKMRELAMNEYGCLEFVSVTEGDQEVSISYWNEQKDIIEWKKNSEHLAAQELGKSEWYKSYHVQVVEVVREYRLENR